jgi:hypothetical protein
MPKSRGVKVFSFGSMVVAGLALALGALTLPDSRAQAQTPEDEIQATLQEAMDAWNDEDIETFLTFFTEEGLQEVFDIGDEDPTAFLTADREETGPIASITASDLSVTSGNASGFVDIQFEAGFSLFEEWDFVFLDGGWKVNGAEPAFRPIPEGVPAVDMTLQEYAFVYNADAISAADGNFAFDVANVGQEDHEIVLFEITTDAPLSNVLDAIAESGEDEQPEGVGSIEFLGFFESGQEGTAIPPSPLAAGRYGLICFVPSADGTPHAFLGMVSEFTVGGAAPAPDDDDDDDGISPPSTGDAGILDSSSGTLSWLMLGMAITLVLGGTAGLVAIRRSAGA